MGIRLTVLHKFRYTASPVLYFVFFNFELSFASYYFDFKPFLQFNFVVFN